MATTKTASGRSARTNALVQVISILGILVLLNVLGMWVFGRVDLTQNRRYTLSDVSREAVRALDDVDVQVFISKDLPATVSAGYGRERDIRGVDREFLDKLAEYQSYSGGNLRINVVTEDIEDKAAKAKLELFTGKKAEVAQDGVLEFKKYAIGATFQYRNQMEVFAQAMEPEYFEFEVTKILMRLKEKYEKSAGMKDVLDAGKAITDATKACGEKIDGYRKKDGAAAPGGALSALVGGGSGDALANLRADRQEFKRQCDAVAGSLASAATYKGKNELLDQLLSTAQSYVGLLDELSRQLDQGAAQGGQPGQGDQKAAMVLERLSSLDEVVERDNDNLKNSPGRKAIGFLCGHREFCPFADRPLMRPELAAMLGQRNPLVQQFVGQAKQIEDQINMVNEQIRKGVFTRKGLTVKRIDAGEDIPDDVEVLVVYAPQKPLSQRDLYNIDQFLLSGRSVLFFLNQWDVAVYNVKKGGEGFDPAELTFDELHREGYPTNLDDFLAAYGAKPNRDLVVEPASFEPITIIQLQKQGQFTLQSQREFPFPLLPTFTEMDRQHVLVRRLSNLTLPYASTIEITEAARGNPAIEVTELVKTSADATATTDNLELSPPMLLRQVKSLSPNGPKPVAVVLKGEFRSFFDGKEVPARDEKKPDPENLTPQPKPVDRPFLAKGAGRLLVVGSNLGLENLSSEKVFEGFSMSQLTSGTADFFLKLKDYVANFQNWQLRLTQVSPIVQANLDFLFNALDWGVQNEGLVDIRSKGLVHRPLKQLSDGAQTAVALSLIVGLPALFAVFGFLRFVSRRRGRAAA